MSQCKSWGDSSVFEWLCCVCSRTRLGPGPRQQGRQVQEEGFPTLGTERSAEWRGRSAAEVCTSEARKIGVPLVTRQGASPPCLFASPMHTDSLTAPFSLLGQLLL